MRRLDGFIAGTLACAGDCTGFDTAGCIAPGCGNDILEPDTEACDGSDLGGTTCEDFDGLFGDGLACAGDCQGFDTSACLPVVCGDDIAAGDEECDGADLSGLTCDDLPGFIGDTGLACADDCTFDTAACTPDPCGNGVVDDGETCDGLATDGSTCTDFGFSGGTLQCNATCDDFDTLECSDDIMSYCSTPDLPVGPNAGTNTTIRSTCRTLWAPWMSTCLSTSHTPGSEIGDSKSPAQVTSPRFAGHDIPVYQLRRHRRILQRRRHGCGPVRLSSGIVREHSTVRAIGCVRRCRGRWRLDDRHPRHCQR